MSSWPAWPNKNGESIHDRLGSLHHSVSSYPGELQGKCGKVFDPEALGSFAVWGLLEFLETVHKPLVQAWGVDGIGEELGTHNEEDPKDTDFGGFQIASGNASPFIVGFPTKNGDFS